MPSLWDESGAEAARAQAGLLQQAADGPVGYRLERIILTNFWLYEHQEFEIPHGRLFLAGDNRSGKSTVLTAAITLALDGDYRPERIDTFGKREKRIDYYIIGGQESNTPYQRDQRTTYIALEFAWRGTDQPPFASELRARWERGEYEQARYLTIGVVFAGNRNSATPINCTRFLITDGSRLDRDKGISTMQGSGGERRACDVRTFKKALAERGLVCETQREYEQKVIQYLFRFADSNDFHRLIRQLLYLRQPNLNSVLSLDSVRTFLDQSLPALPAELIQHAATTLELMDSLQIEIERRQEAFAAVERLHRAQQIVSLVQARLAACEYVHDQFGVNAAQGEVQRLKRARTRAENDLGRARGQIEALESEQVDLSGQVAALEGSEGLQAARRLNQVQEVVANLEKNLGAQSQILDDASQRREQASQAIEVHRQTFEQMHRQSSEQLAALQHLAGQVARWSIAADQLAELLQQVRTFSLESAAPHFSTQISSLQDVHVGTRLDWLRVLKQLHQEAQAGALQLQFNQRQETAAYEALDSATRQFEREREALCQAQQELADRLDELLEQSDWQSHFHPLHERASLVWNENNSSQEIVEHLGALGQDYRREISQVLGRLKTMSRQLQQNLEQLRGEQGARRAAVQQAWEAYEHKRQEPEYTPASRPAHRAQARQVLEAHGIAALPLYMLLDFAPEIDSQSGLAGRIELLLEDAGLLDSLVVLPEQTAAADALLASEGLSDCRLDLARLAAAPSAGPFEGDRGPLRADPALRELMGEQVAGWEEVTRSLLRELARAVYPDLAWREAPINWSHGLLAGVASAGTARCIGRATRVREQQRALEQLHQQWEALESQLQTINQQIEQLELRRQTQETLENHLSGLWESSEIDSCYTQLRAALGALKQAEARYQERRAESQTLRQRLASLRIELQKASGEVPLFASDAEQVNQAYDATSRLGSEQRALLSYLERLRAAWQDQRAAQEQLAQNKAAEWRAAQAYQKATTEAQRARAELEALLQLVRQTEQSGVESLLERLQALQARQQSLPEELQTARERRAVAENALQTCQENEEGVLAAFEVAWRLCDESYQRFLARLDAYPVELLVSLKQREEHQAPLELAQGVLATPLEAREELYHQRKTELEGHREREQNALITIVHEVNNLLHEYAPQYDEQGIIRFQNAERANAAELLNRLGEEISHQQRLLETRERELFQNFLLEELADAIGKHITDAEDWVKRMNRVLSQTAFVGAYYHLRWSPRREEQARTQSVGQLAQYHDLLRRQAQTFKQEEIDQLVHAFRQEINALRAQPSQSTDAANFSEALARIFDYRNWFQFEIFTSRPDGSSLHLTNRFFKKGSGAEQYVTLYIPFFAALSALYDSAGEGAPRLIALDEAFDKVSVENTRQLLTFLAQQQFQWIMTGPRVTGEGAAIPACVKYTMFCDKDRELAAGFPSFWSTDLALVEQKAV
ncbi:MAG TPA: SbcC/MukB-like Walker B domain-containing protein [Ktedonobacteraceae bacterium]